MGAAVTVAVPSHGGHERLGGLLESLCGQDLLKDYFEVLIVDNASPIPLNKVARRYSGDLAIRVVREPDLGVAHARNRALSEVSTPILVFLDDDVVASPALLRTYAEAFGDLQLKAAGGPIRPRLSGRQPAWFRGPALPLYALQDLGQATEYWGRYPFSANCAMRMDAVHHRFDVRLGRRGRSLLSGEERRFFEQNAFPRIAHLPGASVEHVIPEERLRLRWVARRAFAQVRTRAVLRATE